MIGDETSGDAAPLLELEGETSCSSNERKRGRLPSAHFAKLSGRGGRSDVKGKEVLSQKALLSGGGLRRRRRRRRVSVDKGRVSTGSSSSSSHLQLIGEKKEDVYEESSVNADSEGDHLLCECKCACFI